MSIENEKPPAFQPGTEKPEEKYARLNDLGRRLKLPVPQMFVTLESYAPDGTLVTRHHQRSRTPNRNFWNWIFVYFCGAQDDVGGNFGAGYLAMKDTGGSIRTTMPIYYDGTYTAGHFDHHSGSGIVTHGFRVGTGSAAESFDGYALTTPCAEGTGTDQFNHAAMTKVAGSYDSGSKVWTMQPYRWFNNNSAGTIVVTETGIYIASNVSFWTKYYYMVCRDLLGASVSVLSGGALKLTYTFLLTYPA